MTLRDRITVEPLGEDRLAQLERRVVAAAADAAAPRHRSARRLGWRVAAAAAVAAGLLGWIARGAPGGEPAPIVASTARDHAVLDIGDARIDSDPEAAFTLTRPAGGVLVAMTRGKIELAVGKRGDRPPLVVRAGATDVIVVGTRFTVDYGDGTGEVEVRVSEGVVRVVHREHEARVAAGQAWQTRRGVVASRELEAPRGADSTAPRRATANSASTAPPRATADSATPARATEDSASATPTRATEDSASAAPTRATTDRASAAPTPATADSASAAPTRATADSAGTALPPATAEPARTNADSAALPRVPASGQVAIGAAPGATRDHIAAVPGAPRDHTAVPGVAAPSPTRRAPPGPATPATGEPTRRHVAVRPSDPRIDLWTAIRAQPVDTALALGGLDPAAAVAKYYDIAAHTSGAQASQAFYSIAVVRHANQGRDADALQTLDAYVRRFPGGKEYRAALWLRVRILCLAKLDDRCRAAAYTYLQEAPDGPAARIAEQITVAE